MYYRQIGSIPPKRHTVFVGDDGHRRHEQLIGHEGFSSRSSLLYHLHSPSALTAIEPLAPAPELDTTAASYDHPIVPRHLRTSELPLATDPVLGRHRFLTNADVTIGWAATDQPSPLYRNACGDELIYVQSGTARLETIFGGLDVGAGDYVVIPAATTHRWLPDGGIELLTIESRGHVEPPAKYLTASGQFQEHAPYCERDLRAPTEPLIASDRELLSATDIIVRTAAGLTRHTYATHPFDVVGWDGQLFPWVFNITDFEPIVGSLHQPPPVHQTFAAPGIVVCSFVPRWFDFHPDAVQVPYHHSNTDSDEVLFYSDGDFMSRAGSGIAVGSISYHPAGFVHGPQPGSYEKSIDKQRTEETAVMIDTFAPLRLTDTARSISADGYEFSWQ